MAWWNPLNWFKSVTKNINIKFSLAGAVATILAIVASHFSPERTDAGKRLKIKKLERQRDKLLALPPTVKTAKQVEKINEKIKELKEFLVEV